MPRSCAWKRGRPWCPDCVMRARRLPARSSRNVSNALRFVFGPSRRVSEACTMPASRCWAASPSAPTSANPAAKITANFGFFSTTASNASMALPVRITARSTSPGTSSIDRKHGTPSTLSRFGFTGWKAAPNCSDHARILRVIADFGLFGVSDAPSTATERGRKNVSRSATGSRAMRARTLPDVRVRFRKPGGFLLAQRGRRGTVDEGPLLHRDAPPVAGGPQLAEHAPETEVDALEDHEAGGHVRGAHDVAVLAGGVEEPAHALRRPLRCRRELAILHHELPEMREVRLDLFIGEPARIAHEAALGHCGAELRHVLLDGERLGQRCEQPQFGGGEVLHQSEVEERDAPTGVEQVVARVRVTVERTEPVEAAEHESVDGFGREVFLRLRPLEQLVEAGPFGQFGRERAPRRQFVDDLGDRDERM